MTVRTNSIESTGKQCGMGVLLFVGDLCDARHLPQEGFLSPRGPRPNRKAGTIYFSSSFAFPRRPPLSALSLWPLRGSERGGHSEPPCCLLFWGGGPFRPSLPQMLPNRRPPPTPTSNSSSFEGRGRDLESNLPAQIGFFCVFFSQKEEYLVGE